MKILLIYPQYIYHDTYDARSASLSLLYLGSRLEMEGHNVAIFDASMGPITPAESGFVYGVDNEEVIKWLENKKFDVVGITCSFAARWRFVTALAEIIKKMMPDVPVITGGLFPTSKWKFCFEKSRNIDIVMLGEGEDSLAQVVRNLESGASISQACIPVDGVVWRDGDEIKKNDKRDYIRDLDRLPFPAWHLIDLNRFFSIQKNFYELRPPYFTVLSSRGCPEICTFCNMFITHGKRWRFRSPENFVDELEFLSKKYKVKNFFIADDNFSFNLERAKNICKEILKRKLNIHYNTGNGLSIKRIDKELLELMKASGCGSVALAIESGSEVIRNQVYKKRLATEKIYEAVKWCNDVGLPSVGFFMVGAPGETRESVDETKRMLKDLPLTLCTCGIYTPYPGTELYDDCVQKGYLKEVSPEDEGRLEFATSMLKTPDFSPEDVKTWQNKIYLHFIKHKWNKLIGQLISPKGIITFSHFSIFKRLLNIKELPLKLKKVFKGFF